MLYMIWLLVIAWIFIVLQFTALGLQKGVSSGNVMFKRFEDINFSKISLMCGVCVIVFSVANIICCLFEVY